MLKRDDSLRSLGITSIAVDVQLREDIKNEAAKRGYDRVSDYLRAKVEQDKKSNPQAVMTSITSPQARIESKLDTLISSIQSIVPESDKPENVVEFVARMMLAFSSLKTFTDKDYRYSEAKKLADDSYRTAESITQALDKAIKSVKENSAAKQVKLNLQES